MYRLQLRVMEIYHPCIYEYDKNLGGAGFLVLKGKPIIIILSMIAVVFTA